MSTALFNENPFVATIREIRGSWGWFLTEGILLVVIGSICIIGNVTATFVAVTTAGWLLMIGGGVALVHGFRVRTWSGFFMYLFIALMRGFTGYLLVRYPLAGAAGFTLILASFFVVSGLFRIIGASFLKFPSWGWSVFAGLVSMVLGIMLLGQMPVSSLWFLGFAIGLEMLFDGVALIGAAVALRSLPVPAPYIAKAA